MKKFYLRCGEAQPFGSVEHFYHFMWGYLLPSTFKIIELKGSPTPDASNERYYLRSCGPLMNRLLEELFGALQLDYTIEDKSNLNAAQDLEIVDVPRWDIWLDQEWSYQSTTPEVEPKEIYPTIEDILTVREFLLDKLLPPIARLNATAKASYLFLKRSVQHDYYKPGGLAEIPSYGVGRRELLGIEEAVRFFNEKGIASVAFEPGRCRLQEQINAFYGCRGAVGIRGAEIANLIWMRQGSKVVILNPSDLMYIRPPARPLARIFKLDYVEINVGAQLYPVLDPHLLVDFLSA